MNDTIDQARIDRIYIAGPMSGYHRFNEAEFKRVAEAYRADGFTVISPVELDEGEGVDYNAEVTPEQYRTYLLRDLVAILSNNVEAIVVLDGWRDSKGAALEVHVARHIGLPIYDEDGVVVKEPTKYRPPSDETILEEAQRIVGGDRQDQYGHPGDDFARTAGAINAYFGTEFRATDIPFLMILVKLSRIMQTPDKRDSWVDICGYAETAELTFEREGRPLS
jgi:hypothetical protein